MPSRFCLSAHFRPDELEKVWDHFPRKRPQLPFAKTMDQLEANQVIYDDHDHHIRSQHRVAAFFSDMFCKLDLPDQFYEVLRNISTPLKPAGSDISLPFELDDLHIELIPRDAPAVILAQNGTHLSFSCAKSCAGYASAAVTAPFKGTCQAFHAMIATLYNACQRPGALVEAAKQAYDLRAR